MKFAGKTPPGPNVEYAVFPRPATYTEGDEPTEINNDIVIECRAVLDYSKFDAMVPEPEPPMSKRPGQDKATPNPEHPTFIKAVQKYSMLKANWMYIQSMSGTPGMEWEQVKLDDPQTWERWPEELRETLHMTESELIRLTSHIHSVNGMDDAKIEEARKRFLATKREASSR